MIKQDQNQIFINADDFGYHESVNQAIYRSFKLGLIQSTSMLVNMLGFDDAVRIFLFDPILSDKVGLHINLTEGYPLSNPIKSCPRFCDESGNFIYKREHPLFFLSKQEKTAIYQEISEQIEKLRTAGIQPAHIDSHHHIHTEWPVFKIALHLAKQYGIQKIRIARNLGRQDHFIKKQYRNVLNIYLKYFGGRANSDFFGDIEDFAASSQIKHEKNKLIEIMVHPKLNSVQEIIDYNGNLLKDRLLVIIPEFNIEPHRSS